LDAIKKGATLKKVDTDQIKKEAPPAGAGGNLGGLEQALKGSLQRYRKFVQQEDDDEDNDNEDWD
jgi:hypothetical protein